MATCSIKTPDPHIDESFGRIFDFLKTYKIDGTVRDAWAPAVWGYGIDQVTPRCQDTRDNRWMVWAARYCEPDDLFLSRTVSSILQNAFDEQGRELHEKVAPDADDYLHYYVWWLLQVALGYLYTGDVTLDLARIRKIVQTAYALFDADGAGMLHTSSRRFVTSIGEPFNTDPGQAYGFFQNCNLAFCLSEFAALADAKGDGASRSFFDEKLQRLQSNMESFRSPDGFFYALKDKASGTFRYRVTEPEGPSVLTDNVFFPLAFGTLPSLDMKPSLDFLLPRIRESFPVPYGHPAYQGPGTMAWWIPRSWQECLSHVCLGLRELEMPLAISTAIKRQADRIALDDEVWEHYDPATGSPHGYHVAARRGYSTTSACLNIAIIEALFGVRPESPGFLSVSIEPAFPASWQNASIDMTTNGRRLAYTMSSSEREVTCDFEGSSTVPASIVIPLPDNWETGKARANVNGEFRVLRGEKTPCFSTRLTLGARKIVLTKEGRR